MTVFAQDPGTFGAIQSFILNNASLIDGAQGTSLDLTKAVNVSRKYQVTRNPIERTVSTGSIKLPISLQVQGTLSANPSTTIVDRVFSAAGRYVRQDLTKLAELEKVFDTGEPMAVVTPIGTFTSMAGEILDSGHSASNKVDLTLQFSKIEIVSPRLVDGVLDLDELLAGVDQDLSGGIEGTDTVTDLGGFG